MGTLLVVLVDVELALLDGEVPQEDDDDAAPGRLTEQEDVQQDVVEKVRH